MSQQPTEGIGTEVREGITYGIEVWTEQEMAWVPTKHPDFDTYVQANSTAQKEYPTQPYIIAEHRADKRDSHDERQG